MTSSKRKLKILTIAEKVNVINMVERSGKKNYEVANAFGIPSSTLSTILKNKSKILTNFKLQPSRKKMKSAEFPDLDSSLFAWYVQCKDGDRPVSGPILKEKACVFAKSLGYSKFKNSTGWLDKWKKRNNVTLRKPSTSAGPNVLQQQQQRKSADILAAAVGEYSPDDIFSAAETGIFYRCLPDGVPELQLSCGRGGDGCHDGRRSKERVTVLLCANMSGTEKVKPLLIGKSARPRCFDGIKSLPTDYESNPKAWMTASLWNKWLKRFDEKLFSENRKTVLFVDNCTAHAVAAPSCLRAITVRFWPADDDDDDDASRLPLRQPLHRGVIQSFKVFYRQEVIRRVTSALVRLQRTAAVSIDLLQAARMTDKSWRRVTAETVSNGFEKAGFPQPPGTRPAVQTTPTRQEPCEEKNNPEWSYIMQHYDLTPEITFNSFVKIDENLTVCSSDFNGSENIVSEVAALTNRMSDNDRDNNYCSSTSKRVTYKEATNAFDILRDFIETTEGMDNIHFEALGTIEDAIDKIKLTETQRKESVFTKKKTVVKSNIV